MLDNHQTVATSQCSCADSRGTTATLLSDLVVPQELVERLQLSADRTDLTDCT